MYKDEDEPTLEIMMSMSPNEWDKIRRERKKERKEGFKEGEITARRSNITQAIRYKHGKLPSKIASRVNKISDMKQLSVLFKRVMTSESLDDVQAALGIK